MTEVTKYHRGGLFKPGTSGNPNGRPKKKKPLTAMEIGARVVGDGEGRPITYSLGMNVRHSVWASQDAYDKAKATGEDVSNWTVVK